MIADAWINHIAAEFARKLVLVDFVDDFLDLCDLDRWAKERRENPTAAERVQDAEDNSEWYGWR